MASRFGAGNPAPIARTFSRAARYSGGPCPWPCRRRSGPGRETWLGGIATSQAMTDRPSGFHKPTRQRSDIRRHRHHVQLAASTKTASSGPPRILRLIASGGLFAEKREAGNSDPSPLGRRTVGERCRKCPRKKGPRKGSWRSFRSAQGKRAADEAAEPFVSGA